MHEDPHLYRLRMSLSTGDEVRTRFGFREFWIDGSDFVLNGSKVHLLASAGWPNRAPMAPDQIRRMWLGVKEAGCVAFRTHTQPWMRRYYDAADEAGLLMIVEGAVFNDDETYRVHDPAFWNHYARHLDAMVRAHRNHPSVVMWSLENEFSGSRMNDASPAKADLIRMGQWVNQWDPTRPMFYESDGDPGGVADVIGIHYPHEYPFYTGWPNESWWLGQPKVLGHRFDNGDPEFFWRKDKPLYIGEFLWIPSHDPSWNTVFLGDHAYIDYHRQRNVAKAESWKMQILGYRHFGVSGMCPWTMMEGGALDEDGSFDPENPLYQAVRHAYQPVAAYCHDYDRRFYAGGPVHRRVEVFHDILEASGLTLAWTLAMNGRAVDQGRKELSLEPADRQMLEVILTMPDVRRRTAADWQLTLTRNGRRVFEDTHRYAVLPRPALPRVAASFGLHDPRGKTRALLEANGLRPAIVDALDKLDPALELLVIGAGALRAESSREIVIGHEHPQRAALMEFVRKGGRLLVLEQEAYPEGLWDAGLSPHRSTMTFPLRPGHPALRGVEPDDLKFWRGDHWVTAAEPMRSDRGGAAAIVVSGSAAGLDHAPLQEDFVGQGCRVFCQLKLIEKFETEPAAAQILSNLLDYLDKYRPAPRKVGLMGGTKDYRDYLQGLGIRFDDIAGSIGPKDLAAYSLVLCRGASDAGAALRAFVEEGGHLREGKDAGTSDVKLRNPAGRALERRPPGRGLAAVAHTTASIHFLTEPPTTAVAQRGRGMVVIDLLRWDTEQRNSRKAARFASSLLAALGAECVARHGVTIECEQMTPDAKLTQFRRQGGCAVFGANGAIRTRIEVAQKAIYTMELIAAGSQVEGVYPLVDVHLDGRKVGSIQLSQDGLRAYPLELNLTQGAHELGLVFVNDRYIPGVADRNVQMDKVVFY